MNLLNLMMWFLMMKKTMYSMKQADTKNENLQTHICIYCKILHHRGFQPCNLGFYMFS